MIQYRQRRANKSVYEEEMKSIMTYEGTDHNT